MRQGHCHHAGVAYDYMGLHLGGRSTPWRSVAQVCNKRGSPSHTLKGQGPSGNKATLWQTPHTRATGTQVEAMAVVQGGQGSRQTRLLARSRTLHLSQPHFGQVWGWSLTQVWFGPRCDQTSQSRVMSSQSPGTPTVTVLGQFRDSNLGVPRKSDIRAWVPPRVIVYTIGE
jgi:hypothetical protein